MSAGADIPAEVREEISRGALFTVNHSGGKDSQATLIRVLDVVPRAQVVVVHATLGRSEWPGALETARDHAASAGVPFVVAKSSSRESFLELVDWRAAQHPESPAYPSSSCRQCTSDLKRDPIMREALAVAKARGTQRIVTCMGMRAQESPRRARSKRWALDTRGSRAGRSWFNWLPVHELKTPEVFGAIRAAGLSPHAAYEAGNERLSCVFCILGSRNDARNGALHNPELFAEHVAQERRVGSTMHRGQTLEQYAGVTVEQAHANRRYLPVLKASAA